MRTLLLAATLVPVAVGSARADVMTYTDGAAFQAALAGTIATQGYEGTGVNSTIPQGGNFGGVVYTFSAPTLGGSQATGRIDGVVPGYLPLVGLGTQSLAVFRTTTAFGEPSNQSFFYPGESITLTFPTPVRAVGIYFGGFDPGPGPGNTHAGDFFIQAAGGQAGNGLNAVPGTPVPGGGPLNPTLYFVGLTSTVPFTTAVIGGIDRGTNGGFNLDNLTTATALATPAAIPEPGTLVAFGLMFAGGLACRRRAAAGA